MNAGRAQRGLETPHVVSYIMFFDLRQIHAQAIETLRSIRVTHRIHSAFATLRRDARPSRGDLR